MECLNSCVYSNRLIARLRSLDTENKLDYDVINKAIYWAKKYHDGQFRKSGEPFYTHPLEVAYMISEYKLTTNVIVTSILHDIVEDTEVTIGMIIDEFGWRIAKMVDMLTRDRPDGTKLTVEEILNNAYEKNDKEVLLVKLIDRLHNMMTIGSMTPKQAYKTSRKTIDQFLCASVYLNTSNIESELIRLSFKKLGVKTESGHNRNTSLANLWTDDYLLSLVSQNN